MNTHHFDGNNTYNGSALTALRAEINTVLVSDCDCPFMCKKNIQISAGSNNICFDYFMSLHFLLPFLNRRFKEF